MQELMAGPPLNWRIVDCYLVSWTNSPLTASQIVSTVPTLRLILDAIPAFVIADHPPAEVPTVPDAYTTGATASAQDTVTPSAPPAGWYPGPTDAGMARWWDGSAWTSHHAKFQAR